MAKKDNGGMARCTTCEQPWPDDKEAEGYFGQRISNNFPAEDDSYEFFNDIDHIRSYTRELFRAMACVVRVEQEDFPGHINLDSISTLAELGQELTDELWRRVRNLHNAAHIWKQRAKVQTPARTETLH